MAFMGISLPSEICQLFHEVSVPGTRVPKQSHHVTLLYLGKQTPLVDICKAVEIAAPIMQRTAPLRLSAGRVEAFGENPDDGYPLIARVDCEGLHELQGQLKAAFRQRGVPFSDKWPEYKPHVTLAYAKEPMEAMTLDPPIEWTAAETVMWAGDNNDDRFVVRFSLPRAPRYESLNRLIENARTALL
jgi:2'-5' RNA ligase